MFSVASTLVISAGVVTVTKEGSVTEWMLPKDNLALEQQIRALGIDPRASQECGSTCRQRHGWVPP